MKDGDTLSPFEVFHIQIFFIYSKTISQKKETVKKTERVLQFTSVAEGALIIYGQLSDSDIQLTTTCLWPVIRACPSDGPLLT